MSDVPERLERLLTAREVAAFMEAFTLANPRWRGAQFADVISELGNTDDSLHVTEPLIEALPDCEPAMVAGVARVWYWTHGIAPTAGIVREILGRHEALRRQFLEAGREP